MTLQATATGNVFAGGCRVMSITVANEHAVNSTTVKVYDDAGTGTTRQVDEIFVSWPSPTVVRDYAEGDGWGKRFLYGVYLVIAGGTPVVHVQLG